MKYMGHVTAAMVVIAASAVFAQSSDTPPPPPAAAPVAAPAPVALPAPVVQTAPAPETQPAPFSPPPVAAAPAAPPAPAPAVPAPAVAPSSPTPSPVPAEAAPAPDETPAAPEAKKKHAKKKTHRAQPAAESEWPDSPAMAKRLEAEATLPGVDTSGAIPAMPLDVMTNGNVTYVTGGIGDEELDQLRTMGSQFDLHLLFSAVTGEYISDVMLRVLDEKHMEVLSVMNAGPYLYIKLPPGSYTIEATSEGNVKTAKVTVPQAGFARLHIAYTE